MTWYWKFIVLTILIVGNLMLFFSLSAKRESREQLHFLLTHNEGLSDYLEHQSEQPYQISYSLERTPSATRLISVSDSFRMIIHELQRASVPVAYDKMTQEDYFESIVAVPQEQQERLWKASQNYINSLAPVILEYIPAQKRKADSLYHVSQEHVKAKEQALLSRPLVYHPIDQKALLMMEVDLPFLRTRISGYKLKSENFIHWQSAELANYQRVFEEKISSPKPLQASKQFSKLSNTFVTKGKIMVYGRILDLSHLTPAELQSACKYLLMEKAQTETTCQAALREFIMFR